MTALAWDKAGERFYETGVEKGVLYPYNNSAYQNGVAWNGLINVTEKPTGGEAKPLYADDIKYLNLMSKEEFGCGIEAYTYPPEFDACNGTKEVATGIMASQQDREEFGFCYRTKIGNDTEGTKKGYKIHLVYGAKAAPSEVAHQSETDDPEALTFSWDVTTTPVECPGMKPTAHLTIDSRKVSQENMKKLEDKLYGNESGEATLLLPKEVIALVGPGPEAA